MLAQGSDSHVNIQVADDPSGPFSGAAPEVESVGLGLSGLKFSDGCLVLEPFTLPLVLDLLELAAELLPFVQRLSQLRLQGFGTIRDGGGAPSVLARRLEAEGSRSEGRQPRWSRARGPA